MPGSNGCRASHIAEHDRQVIIVIEIFTSMAASSRFDGVTLWQHRSLAIGAIVYLQSIRCHHLLQHLTVFLRARYKSTVPRNVRILVPEIVKLIQACFVVLAKRSRHFLNFEWMHSQCL
jgi:hypothetical protein